MFTKLLKSIEAFCKAPEDKQPIKINVTHIGNRASGPGSRRFLIPVKVIHNET